jgi:hypothetical protein
VMLLTATACHSKKFLLCQQNLGWLGKGGGGGVGHAPTRAATYGLLNRHRSDNHLIVCCTGFTAGGCHLCVVWLTATACHSTSTVRLCRCVGWVGDAFTCDLGGQADGDCGVRACFRPIVKKHHWDTCDLLCGGWSVTKLVQQHSLPF